MRTTITVDDDLFDKFKELMDPGLNNNELIREALKIAYRIESTRRLIALGGTAPEMQDIPRRRIEP